MTRPRPRRRRPPSTRRRSTNPGVVVRRFKFFHIHSRRESRRVTPRRPRRRTHPRSRRRRRHPARIMCRVSCRFTCRANVPATSGRAWSAEENVSEACMLIPDVCRAWTWTRVTSRSSRSSRSGWTSQPSPPSFLALYLNSRLLSLYIYI